MVTIQGYRPTSITRVLFVPQRWEGDYAVTAAPQGDSTWEPDDLPALLAYYKDFEDAFKYERWFDDDPACPDWIKNCDGPFCDQVFAVRAFEPR